MKVPNNSPIPSSMPVAKPATQQAQTTQPNTTPTENTEQTIQTTDTSKTLNVKKDFFTKPPVKFPELTDKKQKIAGLGEILGGLGAVMAGSPSRSLGPAIEHGDKELQKRRAPEKKTTKVKTETATQSIQESGTKKQPKTAPAFMPYTQKAPLKENASD